MIRNLFIFNFKSFIAPAIFILAWLLGEGIFRVKYFGFDAILNVENYMPTGARKYKRPVSGSYGDAFTLVPNEQFRLKGKTISTNKHGFRERDIDLPAINNKYRIAVLGSSYAMGTGVLEEERYSNQLQKMLDKNFPNRYEVVNFAVPGTSIQRAIALYESRVSKHNPDFILYSPRYLRLVNKPKRSNVKPIKHEGFGIREQLFEKSFLYKYIRYEFKKLRLKYFRTNWKKRLEGDVSQVVKRNISQNTRLLTEFLQRRSSEQIPAILLSIPKLEPDMASPVDAILLASPDDAILKELTKNIPGIYYGDLYPPLAGKISINDAIYPGEGHPNARVHKLYAEAIFDILVPILIELGLIE